MNTTPLARTALRDQVRQVLIDGLLSGRWRPGERIVERRIAAELGVSQAPVREALRELESLRVIESMPNRGARVAAFTEQDMLEIFPVRAGLEETAADLAVPRIAGRVEPLECHVDALRTAADKGDKEAQGHHAFAFHREIVMASGNRLLLSVWESLGIELWATLAIRHYRTELHENVADHDVLVEAFRHQDPATGRMLRDHVMSYAPKASC